MGWGDALRASVPCVLAVALTSTAGAATITVHDPDSHGRVFVDLVGKIEDGDVETFQAKTAKVLPANSFRPKIIVTLVSPGGNTGPAMRIGDLIRRNAMSTFVPGDRTCASACALIWLAGASRIVGDTPQIGFHATYDAKTRRESGVGNALIGAYLRDLGFGYKAISFMTSKGPMSVEWLTPDLAKDLGVTWAMLQPARAIPVPPQPKLQPKPPHQVTAAWSKSTRSLAPQQSPTAMAPPSPKLMPVVVRTSREPSVTPPQFPPAAPASSPQHSPTATAPKPHAAQGAPAPQQALATAWAINVLPTPGFPIVAQRVVLYEEDPSDPAGKRFVGSATWRTEIVSPGSGQAPELAVRADVEIPERRLAMTLSIRRNADQALPASHMVEIMFNLPGDFPFGGVSHVPGILSRQGAQARGAPLSG